VEDDAGGLALCPGDPAIHLRITRSGLLSIKEFDTNEVYMYFPLLQGGGNFFG
jgi:hypothetical protein